MHRLPAIHSGSYRSGSAGFEEIAQIAAMASGETWMVRVIPSAAGAYAENGTLDCGWKTMCFAALVIKSPYRRQCHFRRPSKPMTQLVARGKR